MPPSMAKSPQALPRQRPLDGRRRSNRRRTRPDVRRVQVVQDCGCSARKDRETVSRAVAQSFESGY
eukprot:CCRYP_008013-RE/>CCRYP_008013-RE protein AED:0.48 eAED:0.48 QI:0/-1/0/1/-1/0/1/0/65